VFFSEKKNRKAFGYGRGQASAAARCIKEPKPVFCFFFRKRRLVSLFIIALGTIGVSWLWALNGFPLVFPDTATYLRSGLTLTVPWDRPIFYGLLLRALHPAGLWAVALAQTAAAVAAIQLSFAYLDRARPWATAALLLLLAAFTSLPWFAPLLIPDIFLGIALLALHALLFPARPRRAWQQAGLAVVLLAGLLVHTSHILIVAALLPCLALTALACRFARARLPAIRMRGAGLAAATGALLAAIAACLCVNHQAFGEWSLSPGGHAFLIDRFMADGTLKPTLDRHCADHPQAFADCSVRGRLPTRPDWYLWSGESPFPGHWLTAADGAPAAIEAGRIAAARAKAEDDALIALSLHENPWGHARASAAAALRQMVMVRTGNELVVHAPWRYVEAALRDSGGGAGARYQASLQARGALPVDAATWIDAAFLGLAALGAGAALARDRRLRGSRSAGLLAFTLLAWGVNGALCGALSGPHDRYTARIAWLLAAGCVAVVMEGWRAGGVPAGDRSPGPGAA
jgi:hypothetical protein